MESSDIPFLSATELSRLLKGREVSPVEATKAYLERIDNLDFKYNSYLTVSRGEALEAARQAERAIARGEHLGPMHGVPVAVKDQLWTKGIRTTGGSRFLADHLPDEDATAIANLKKAGAVLLGKLNMSEFALTGFSHSHSYPRNPWNLDMSAGGSSSGSGAATAAFLCATSLGEDTGGSIRRPAAWCNLVGLVPSWGRVSRYGLLRGVWSMDTVGPVSRTVEDAAMTLGAIAGYDPKDLHTWNSPVPDYRQALDGNIGAIRIGMVAERINGELVEPEVREAVVKASEALAGLGASVEEVSIPLTTHDGAILATLLAVEPALDHRAWIRDRLRDYGHDNRIGLADGQHHAGPGLLQGPKAAKPAEKPGPRSPRNMRRAAVADDGQAYREDRGGPGDHQQAELAASAISPHPRVQPGQRPLDIRTLRIHQRGTPPRAPDRRTPRPGWDPAEGGPRLRATHTLAHHEAPCRLKRVSYLVASLGGLLKIVEIRLTASRPAPKITAVAEVYCARRMVGLIAVSPWAPGTSPLFPGEERRRWIKRIYRTYRRPSFRVC